MKIDKATRAALPEAMRILFKPVKPADAADTWKDDDATEFDNGEEDAGALKRSLENERGEKQRIAQERDALKKTQDAGKSEEEKAKLKNARDTGDVATLEKSYQDREKNLIKERNDALAQRDAEVSRLHIKGVTDDLSGIFTAPAAVADMIGKRLKVEFVDGKAVTRVLDKEGQVTANSVEDLKNEFLTDASLKPIIKASNGGGGGATPPNGSGGSGATSKKWGEATVAERNAILENKIAANGGTVS